MFLLQIEYSFLVGNVIDRFDDRMIVRPIYNEEVYVLWFVIIIFVL